MHVNSSLARVQVDSSSLARRPDVVNQTMTCGLAFTLGIWARWVQDRSRMPARRRRSEGGNEPAGGGAGIFGAGHFGDRPVHRGADLADHRLPLLGVPALRAAGQGGVLAEVHERREPLEVEAAHEVEVRVDEGQDRSRRAGRAAGRPPARWLGPRTRSGSRRHRGWRRSARATGTHAAAAGVRDQDDEAEMEHRRPVVERPRDALARRDLQRRVGVLRQRAGLPAGLESSVLAQRRAKRRGPPAADARGCPDGRIDRDLPEQRLRGARLPRPSPTGGHRARGWSSSRNGGASTTRSRRSATRSPATASPRSPRTCTGGS